MKLQIKKYGLLVLIFGLLGFLNYHPQMLLGLNSPHWGWMFSLLSTFLIICLMRRRDSDQWAQKLGINFKKADLLKFLVLTILLSILAYFIVDHVALLDGYYFNQSYSIIKPISVQTILFIISQQIISIIFPKHSTKKC